MSLNSEIGSPVRTDNAITALYSTARDVQHEMRVELNKVWNSVRLPKKYNGIQQL